ncbi:MAG: 2-C-methyl-D-erythritol 2,4-cyclodiphosphate synthase [Bacteroidales bacterium]|nr:2-C-methyl-D-erythritol 2,4-cyclodiphosphate synthase [Bacteroidales bacterium]
MRTGFGYDVHQLKEGNTLVIGGVEIPHTKGAVAHSDGDVLIHAICDALLGAACLGDIGIHFPDSSLQYKNIDSRILLAKTIELISEKGYQVGNIDSTVCLQTPKLKDNIPQMRQVLAEICKISTDQMSVKATTTEKLGFVGKEEGIEAFAVVLLIRM